MLQLVGFFFEKIKKNSSVGMLLNPLKCVDTETGLRNPVYNFLWCHNPTSNPNETVCSRPLKPTPHWAAAADKLMTEWFQKVGSWVSLSVHKSDSIKSLDFRSHSRCWVTVSLQGTCICVQQVSKLSQFGFKVLNKSQCPTYKS